MTGGVTRPVALVTGGGTGIGFACVEDLARRGFRIMICGRRKAVLAAARDQLCRKGAIESSELAVRVADLRDSDAAGQIVEACVAEFGRIDALINNAGSWHHGSLLELTAAAWKEVLAVNLVAPALAGAAAARAMIDQHSGGRIVHVASLSGSLAEPGWAHYSCSKAALMALTRSMAVEFAPFGIRTNAVSPGWIATDLAQSYFDTLVEGTLERTIPVERVGVPAEVAKLIGFLCSEAPDFLNGEVIAIDGGQGIMAAMPQLRDPIEQETSTTADGR